MNPLLHIPDQVTYEKSFQDFVRKRAKEAGSYIIYVENGQIIQEDPATGKKIVLKSLSDSKSHR